MSRDRSAEAEQQARDEQYDAIEGHSSVSVSFVDELLSALSRFQFDTEAEVVFAPIPI
jgi:hypothetical protein